MTAKNPCLYEIMIWMRHNDADGGVNELALAKIRSSIAERGGEILRQSRPSKRQTSYLIKKQRVGIWMTFEAKMLPDAVKTLPEAFKHESDILRMGIFRKSGTYPVAPQRKVIAPINAPPKSPESKIVREVKPEIKIEELDKKLKELLNPV